MSLVLVVMPRRLLVQSALMPTGSIRSLMEERGLGSFLEFLSRTFVGDTDELNRCL